MITKIWKCGKDTNLWLALGTWALALLAYCALRESQTTSEQQLRAYVYAMPSDAYHVDGKEGSLQVYTLIGNSGRTFAKNVVRLVGMEVLPPTIPGKLDDLGEMHREEGMVVLSPGSPPQMTPVIRTWEKGSLSNEQFQQIQAGNLRIYVFGTITYDDVFGGQHYTDFCHAYFGPETAANYPGSQGYNGWQAKYCENGNEVGDLPRRK